MLASPLSKAAAALVVVVVALFGAEAAGAAPGNGYVVTPLVSDNGVPGTTPDPNLVNAWGLAAGPTTPWWVADNGPGLSTLYTGAGAIVPLVVSVSDAPTGLVFNSTPGFRLANGNPARFMFATEGGLITGWNGGTVAQTVVDMTAEGAVFKGLAVAQTADGPRLYATDFHNRKVDVFDGSGAPVQRPFAFVDPTIPADYGPFGIQAIGSRIFVTFAKTQPGSDDEAHGQGLGFVDAFDATTGLLAAKVAMHGRLNAPWGLAPAPASFGRFGGDLLVGNFGDGHIDAYRPVLGGLLYVPQGQLRTPSDGPVQIDGLWALQFGNGATAGPTDRLFFTAGPNDEQDGLFGSISPGP